LSRKIGFDEAWKSFYSSYRSEFPPGMNTKQLVIGGFKTVLKLLFLISWRNSGIEPMANAFPDYFVFREDDPN